MKTTFKAKIIFESTQLVDYDPDKVSENEFSFNRLKNILNNPYEEIRIECILDYYTNQYEPLIIIKHGMLQSKNKEVSLMAEDQDEKEAKEEEKEESEEETEDDSDEEEEGE